MKVYIAGKITGDPGYLGKFRAAEEKLQALGYETVNPAAPAAGRTYKEWIDRGMTMLRDCDAIFLLRDWMYSMGATLERRYATVTGMVIMEQDTPPDIKPQERTRENQWKPETLEDLRRMAEEKRK